MAGNKISALIHTCNNERSLGRTLETLRAVDEIVIVDHGSIDNTIKIAGQYGARVIAAADGQDDSSYAAQCAYDWILCLDPNESIAETLEAALFEWKQSPCKAAVCNVAFREEQEGGWRQPVLEARLANRRLVQWKDRRPVSQDATAQLPGHLLRFR